MEARNSEFNKYIDESKLTVIIDPLDATKEYSEGLYQYNSIMVCFVYENEPIIGITYFPKFDEAFWVYAKMYNSNNFHNVEKIFNLTRHNDSYNLIASRSHFSDIEAQKILKKFKQKVPNLYFEKAGGAGYKTILVTAKIFDVYFHYSQIKLWDVCNSIVFSKHFRHLNVYDKNLNNLIPSLDSPILKNGFILASNTTYLSTLFREP